MLFLLCMTNHLQAGRNLLLWKNTMENARSPAMPLSSRAVLASSPLQPDRCRNVALRALLPTLNPWVGVAGVGCRQGGLGRALAWGQMPEGRGVAGRGKLCRGTTAPSQLSAVRVNFYRENSGEQMVKHPTRESRSHPFPMPPTAPDTSKFPEFIDYQGQISILLNYNLVLMHIFTLYLFHVGN